MSLDTRDEEVLAAIESLSKLPVKDIVELARIPDQQSGDFVRTECLLYFIRHLIFADDKAAFSDLFVILRERILRAVPVYTRREAASGKLMQRGSDLEVREHVLQMFQEMLCEDQKEYRVRLDFYECKFNSALARLQVDARRRVPKVEKRKQQLTADPDFGEISAEIETALQRMKEPFDPENVENCYQLRLSAAISTLPDDERRVIELILSGLPIEPQDAAAPSIVKVLGCVEKTVRNRRDRAYKKLHDALKEEEDT